jgi:hypothetical protein
MIIKLQHLPTERLTLVDNFIDFPEQRDQKHSLRGDFAQASQTVFQKTWDNDDAVYDAL